MSHVLNFQFSEIKTQSFIVEKIHDNTNLVLNYMLTYNYNATYLLKIQTKQRKITAFCSLCAVVCKNAK